MRSIRTGAEAPKASWGRRLVAATVIAGMGFGLAACGESKGAGSDPKSCNEAWEGATSSTSDPAGANISMQQGIAELINKIKDSGAKTDEAGNAYEIDTIPQGLVGTAVSVLDVRGEHSLVALSSPLQDYATEFCTDEFDTSTIYLTPTYLSAVGSLAAAGIKVSDGTDPALTLGN